MAEIIIPIISIGCLITQIISSVYFNFKSIKLQKELKIKELNLQKELKDKELEILKVRDGFNILESMGIDFKKPHVDKQMEEKFGTLISPENKDVKKGLIKAIEENENL